MQKVIAASMVVGLTLACACQVFAQGYAPGDAPASQEIPEEATTAIWAMIDVNEDGRATDKEVRAARRALRVLANHRDPSATRDAVRQAFDANADGVIDEAEALRCLAAVRGVRCPTAARARAFWATFDRNQNGAVEPEEFQAILKPLGKTGQAMADVLNSTLAAIDEDNDHRVTEIETYRRANAMLLIQLATEGDRIASRDPEVWIRFVTAVANLDADANNSVSLKESKAIPGLPQHFMKADKDKDNALTVTELCDYKEKIERLIARSAALRRLRSGNC